MKKGEIKQGVRKQSNRQQQNISAVVTATINELIVETHRLSKFPLCIHQDDAMIWYDRITRSHVIINSRKFRIPDNACKVYSIVYNLLKFRTQINNIISKKSYSSIKTLTCHGVGQGSGNGDTKWTFLSIPIMELVENLSQGFKIQLYRKKKQ